MVRRLMASAMTTATMILIGGAFPTQPVMAADFKPQVPRNCGYEVWSRIDSYQGFHMWDGKTWLKDGPGGVVTADVQKTTTMSASISAGAEISVNELVADSKVTISASVTRTVTTTTGHHYSHSIPARKFGNLQYGAWAYRVSWSKWRQNGNCSVTKLAAGTGTVPTVAVGWKYFSTSS